MLNTFSFKNGLIFTDTALYVQSLAWWTAVLNTVGFLGLAQWHWGISSLIALSYPIHYRASSKSKEQVHTSFILALFAWIAMGAGFQSLNLSLCRCVTVKFSENPWDGKNWARKSATVFLLKLPLHERRRGVHLTHVYSFTVLHMRLLLSHRYLFTTIQWASVVLLNPCRFCLLPNNSFSSIYLITCSSFPSLFKWVRMLLKCLNDMKVNYHFK